MRQGRFVYQLSADAKNMLTADFWKRYARIYDDMNLFISYREFLDEVVREARVKEGDIILEAGAGTGSLALLLEKAGAKVTGLDFLKEALDIYKGKNPEARVVLADLTRPLPFKTGSFDTITCSNVLYGVPAEGRLKVLTEMKRVLKPGGRIVLANIHEKFKSSKIYSDSIKKSIRRNGFLNTLKFMVKVFPSTLKIIYCSAIIKKECKFFGKSLFSFNEQKELLEKAGFADISETKFVYAGQAVLNSGQKL